MLAEDYTTYPGSDMYDKTTETEILEIFNPTTGECWEAKKGEMTVVDEEAGILAFLDRVILIPFSLRTIKQLKEEGFIRVG